MNDIKSKGGDAEIVLGDLSTDAEAAIVTTSALRGGSVDILVNNAGSYEPATWAANLSANGPTGGFFRDGNRISWMDG